MTLTIPNIQSITNASNGYDMQAWDDETDDLAALYASSGTAYVISGVTVSPSSGMTVAVAAGYYAINGTIYSYAGGTVAVSAAGTYDRRDIISINSSGTLTVTAGTQCGTAGWVRTTTALPPVKPSIPANNCLLAEIAVLSTTTTVAAINIVDKTTIGGSAPGTLLARAYYAPGTAHSYTLVNITTGVTALDTTNLAVTFVAPLSGNVKVTVGGSILPGAAAGDKVYFAVVSSTGSPGTLVGGVCYALASAVATAADDVVYVVVPQLITGLTAGSTYTWYFAAAYGTGAASVVAQAGSTNTTAATGAPAFIEVNAA